ncbi:MAG TPA: PAS domain-containing protein, partial [Candidatus Deferrimicrobiaceae bacterium]
MLGVPAGGQESEAVGGRNPFLVRTGITFALLASVVSIHFREPQLLLAEGFRYLYAAVVLSYGWLLARYAFRGTRKLTLALSVVQCLADVVFVSIIVFATGLYDSVFSFMYVVFILLGSIEFFLPGAVLWAALSSLCYTGMLYLQVTGDLVPPGAALDRIGAMQFARAALTNSIAFFLTGLLSGLLGKDVQRTRQRALDREFDFQKLAMFHKYVVENIPSGILTADILGRVNLINGTACNILGVRREDVTGRLVEEV